MAQYGGTQRADFVAIDPSTGSPPLTSVLLAQRRLGHRIVFMIPLGNRKGTSLLLASFKHNRSSKDCFDAQVFIVTAMEKSAISALYALRSLVVQSRSSLVYSGVEMGATMRALGTTSWRGSSTSSFELRRRSL